MGKYAVVYSYSAILYSSNFLIYFFTQYTNQFDVMTCITKSYYWPKETRLKIKLVPLTDISETSKTDMEC